MSAPDEAAGKVEEDFDPHRFDAEPKRKKSKALARTIIIFIVAMLAIGGSISFVQARVNAYFAHRADLKEKAKLEDDAEKADEKKQGSSTKKLRQFEKDEGASASLPAALGKDALPPPLPGGAPGGPPGLPPAGAPVAELPGPKQPGMMLDEAGAAPLAAAPPPQTMVRPQRGERPRPVRASSVQEFAHHQAETAPVTKTEQVSATNLGNRSYLLARGSFIPCVLETQLISNIPGSASCVVPQTIYSDDGKVVLIEKGSKIVGEYKSELKNGDNRIAILWERIKTATGVVLDVDSPVADSVGTMGASGTVDNHWGDRIGAAFLLSLVQDAVSIEIAKKGTPSTNVAAASGMPSATINTGTSLADQVLRSTINIAPTLYKNRGDRVMVYVRRDLWFDSVYQLSQK
jgi:type IV secretion system protein VirB10